MAEISDLPTGLIIWACEGSKREHKCIEVVNESEGIITLFLAYLRNLGINEKKLRARVQCNESNVDEQQKRWSKITGIPLDQFRAPIRKKFKKGSRISSSCIVRYYSVELLKQIKEQAVYHRLL